MPYSANLIAYAFVKKGIDERTFVTQMNLQNLVYFAQGLHLALHNKPLIEEEFQAWKFGPVVPSIYQSYMLYGSAPITGTQWLFFIPEKNLNKLDTEAEETMNFTWKSLIIYNAAKLFNWTHQKGSPWEKVFVDGTSDQYIPNQYIQEYFKRFVVETIANVRKVNIENIFSEI